MAVWETTTGVRGGEGRNFATGSRGKLHRDNEYTQGSSGWFKIIIFFLGPSTNGKNRLFNHHPRIAPVLCEIGVSRSPEMGIGQSGGYYHVGNNGFWRFQHNRGTGRGNHEAARKKGLDKIKLPDLIGSCLFRFIARGFTESGIGQLFISKQLPATDPLLHDRNPDAA